MKRCPLQLDVHVCCRRQNDYSPQQTRLIFFFPTAETDSTTSTLLPQMLQFWFLPFDSAREATSVFDFFSATILPPFNFNVRVPNAGLFPRVRHTFILSLMFFLDCQNSCRLARKTLPEKLHKAKKYISDEIILSRFL